MCISNRKQTLKPKKEDPSMTKESGKLNQLSEYFMPGQLLLATVLHLQGFKWALQTAFAYAGLSSQASTASC